MIGLTCPAYDASPFHLCECTGVPSVVYYDEFVACVETEVAVYEVGAVLDDSWGAMVASAGRTDEDCKVMLSKVA